jgi:anti-sigma factor RsiW
MTRPSEQDLHAYVDGVLDPERRRAVEKSLADDPECAAEVRAWQQDAQQLRAALGGSVDLPDNPALDPARIRARLRARRSNLMVGVALAASVAIGAVAGWQTHAWSHHGMDMPPPMSDAVEAYRTFAGAAMPQLDVTANDAAEMQAWLDRRFASAPRLPDLASSGFRVIGARLLPQIDGPAAMVLYRDAQGDAITLFVRQRVPLPRGERQDRDLLAQYGSGDHYSIALVSHDGRDAAIARRALADVL